MGLTWSQATISPCLYYAMVFSYAYVSLVEVLFALLPTIASAPSTGSRTRQVLSKCLLSERMIANQWQGRAPASDPWLACPFPCLKPHSTWSNTAQMPRSPSSATSYMKPPDLPYLVPTPHPASASPTRSLKPSMAIQLCASLGVLKGVTSTADSELLSLPRTPSLTGSPHSGLCSNVTSSEGPALTPILILQHTRSLFVHGLPAMHSLLHPQCPESCPAP